MDYYEDFVQEFSLRDGRVDDYLEQRPVEECITLPNMAVEGEVSKGAQSMQLYQLGKPCKDIDHGYERD